ncbi:MAG: efflux RND transporter permease subunit, partial [Deltaproteobacteria bacterium]
MMTTPTPLADGAGRLRSGLRGALVATALVLALPQCKDDGPTTASDASAEAEPAVARQRFSIRVRWAGARAVDVDKLVAQPMVASLKGFENIDDIEVTSRENEALAVITLSKTIRSPEVAVTRDGALRRVSTRLPAEAEIVALRGDPTAPPDQLVVLTSDQLPMAEVARLAATLQDKLGALDGVGGVDLLGAATFGLSEVKVTVDPAKLAAFGIEPEAVAAAIQHPAEVPQGVPPRSGLEALGMVVIGGQDAPVRLRDVATIAVDHARGAGVLRLDGKPAVGLAIHGPEVTHEAILAAISPELPPTVKLGWTAGKAEVGATVGLHVSLRVVDDDEGRRSGPVLEHVERAALSLPGGEACLAWTQGPRDATLLLRGRWADVAEAADALRKIAAEL